MIRPIALTPLVLALGLHLFVAAPAAAVSPQAYADATAQFQRATEGQTSAIDGAAAQWRALSDAEPTDPVLRAYAGAATSMRALTTLLPWRKISHAEDGLALLDKALAQLTPAHDAPAHRGVPATLEVRFTAASTFLSLPSMFNRGARGARLLDEVVRSPLLEAAPMAFRAQVWLRAGLEAAKDKRTDEARLWLQKAGTSGTPVAAQAQARLGEL
ncbi:hypothetical protein [Ideonella sp. A 288]|uniref:hypothetical protein n=1 Tax=Ideonella sp. A 288 TaxID=1962181 RepID=UPI000B4ADE4D|nr:hypothetical protein [Ideonella sp. A 288]